MRWTCRWIRCISTGPAPQRRSGGLTGALLLAGLLLLVPGKTALAQQGVISGTVVAQGSLRPLAGAQVMAGGIGTLTNNQGHFRLEGVPGGQAEVRVVLLGYRPTTRSVSVGATGVQFALEERAIELDAIVVTGTPGATQKRAIGNAVTSVDAEKIASLAEPPNVQQMLAARVPGLNILKAAGEVGSGAVTTIRGVGSLALSSEPLIYVDGVRVDNSANQPSAAFWDDAGSSRINDIDPNDIESIEVIKGPAAATLYGTEASNGVIQIITKKGAAGSPKWTLAVQQGANFLQNPAEVYPTVWGRNADGLTSLNIIQNDIDQGFGSPFTTGHAQEYLGSVSGGSDGLRYYVSGSWGRDEGIVDYNWMNKLDLRSNLSYQFEETLNLTVSLGTIRSTTRAASATQPITTHIVWGLPVLRDTPLRGYLGVAPENFAMIEGLEDVNRSTLSTRLQHQPVEWFTHRLTVGGDFGSTRSSALWPRTPEQPGPHGANSRGRKQVINTTSTYNTVDYSATANAALSSRLGSSTSAGVQWFRKAFETDETLGQVFPVPGVETVSSAATRFAFEDFLENRTLGVFVQEQISWNNRLFLTAAVRGDDNSAFGQNYDFVVYPKFSASWVISEEPFFERATGLLNTLKLRGAWGQAGQQPDVFAAIRLYEPVTGPGGVGTLTPENIGNPELKPEVGEELELGFDASFLNERLALEFTYYDQVTRDAIVERPILPSMGFPGEQFVNVGEITNSGMELLLSAGLLRRQNVDWDVVLNYARNDNEIVDLGGVQIPPNAFGQRQVPGYPLSAIFLKKVVSAEFDANGKVVNILCEGGDPVTGGGPAVPCAEAGTAYMGQPVPTWQGSVSSSVTLFRSLQLYGLIDFVGGHQRVNGDIAAGHIFFRNTRCINERPICDPVLAGYDALSQVWQAGVMDAGYAKLRTLSASYTLPVEWVQRVGASTGTFTLAGNNLARLWTAENEKFGHEVTDPEIRQSDVLNAYNQESWPQFTSVVASVRFSF